MKNATFLLIVAATSGLAQVGPPPPRSAAKEAAKPSPPGPTATIAHSTAKVTVTRQTFKTLEDNFNLKLATFNPSDPVYMLGATRGIYLQGIGAIFSAELDLIQSPTLNPFHQKMLKEEVDATYARKMKQLPLLRQAMVAQMISCARSLDSVPQTEQLVMVLRLDYQPGWEIMEKLPSQIVMRADIKSAAAGQIQVEEQ
jgi:hypothetical protein